jgi:transcriptional regulator with GAF, ATPase, and Fis domain
MQAKLLRVLQERELERVGDTRTRKVNVRIIAASNRNLKKEVDEGRFRQDLFYRLSVFPIEVPPLRERREDVVPLAVHFIRQSARRMNRREPQISKAALDQLASYHWPGNVRELQNTIERAIILWHDGPEVKRRITADGGMNDSRFKCHSRLIAGWRDVCRSASSKTQTRPRVERAPVPALWRAKRRSRSVVQPT